METENQNSFQLDVGNLLTFNPFHNFPSLSTSRETRSGVKDSIPAWIKFSIQAPGEIPYSGIYYDPPEEDAATGSVSRNLDNSLLFVPLKPFVAEFPAAKKEEQSDRLSNLVGAGYQAFEDAILNKLTKNLRLWPFFPIVE